MADDDSIKRGFLSRSRVSIVMATATIGLVSLSAVIAMSDFQTYRAAAAAKELARVSLAKDNPDLMSLGVLKDGLEQQKVTGRDLIVISAAQTGKDTGIASWLALGKERAQLSKARHEKRISEAGYRMKLRQLLAKEDAIADKYSLAQESRVLHIQGHAMPESRKLVEPVSKPLIAAPAPAETTASVAPTATLLKPTENPFSPAFWISLGTTFLAGMTTLSTIILNWRADKRAALELSLKAKEAEQKTQEYSMKLMDAESALRKRAGAG
jgi:hypothetical protein